MKEGHLLRLSLLVLFAPCCLPLPTSGADSLVTLQPCGPRIELSWPTAFTNAGPAPVFPEFQVQSSRDLVHWTPLDGKLRGLPNRSGPRLSLWLDRQAGPLFYRIVANPDTSAPNRTGLGGAEVFGYDAQLAAELSSLGLLSVADFATNACPASYLDQLSWDPTTAPYWTNFNSAEPHFIQYGSIFTGQTNMAYSYRLNEQELACFQTNGFVVSERLGSVTFGDAYSRLFNADLPVFVSTDAVLHAWHRSYQSLLEELEEVQLATLLEETLTNLVKPLPAAWELYGRGPLRNSLLDADLYLTVALSLWAGEQVPSSLGDWNVEVQVDGVLQAVSKQAPATVPLFGANRLIDFSQFKTRGHYDASDRLRRYFQAMMWCGRIDLRLATFPPNQEDDIRQLGTALVLHHLLQQSGQLSNWQAIESVTRAFVGVTDSMTFPQLEQLLAEANISSPADVPDRTTLTNLQTRLLTGELGVQHIPSDCFYSPLSREQLRLPRSFAVCGQKFVMDSWALSQVVFDRVQWSPDDGSRVIFGKVIRRKPSGLDIAFSVLGNDQTVPELVTRLTSSNGVPFRDGLPYQHNLLAVRRVVESQDPGFWTNNIYTAWLGALRSLSAPTTESKYPEAMRTRAWAMKTLNTQLASWTELRHDTLLYARQSYTERFLCGYPAGFVEPRPEFWQHMRRLLDVTAAALSLLPASGTVAVPSHSTPPSLLTLDLAKVRSAELLFLDQFKTQLTTLQAIAEKELAQQPLTAAETGFLQDVIERHTNYTGTPNWNGWYPQLFYRSALASYGYYPTPGCDLWDPLVADVHTDLPDPLVGDPGAVIHEAVGQVPLLLLAVDNGPDRMIFAGPVLSHYEFEVPGVGRLSDADWKAELKAGKAPPPPEWTRAWFVPGNLMMPPGYQ